MSTEEQPATAAPARFRPSSPVPLADQIECVERELMMRERVYPRWVAAQKMTARKAAEEMVAMNAVLHTLREIDAANSLFPPSETP